MLEQTLRQAKDCGFDWTASDTFGVRGPTGEPTLPEMRVFFAITMLMSLVKVTVLRDYWEKGWCGHEVVKEAFTRPRFEAILSNLHFADPANRPQQGDGPLDPKDRNWKMDEVEQLFVDAWRDAAEYTQFLAVDESMIKYRGRKDPRKQRLVTKPIKNGLKAFVLAGELSPLATRPLASPLLSP